MERGAHNASLETPRARARLLLQGRGRGKVNEAERFYSKQREV